MVPPRAPLLAGGGGEVQPFQEPPAAFALRAFFFRREPPAGLCPAPAAARCCLRGPPFVVHSVEGLGAILPRRYRKYPPPPSCGSGFILRTAFETKGRR